jgi:glycosidase
LDSHDVSRFLSVCGGDTRRLKLAVIFQMCFVGVPNIFYGDELGFDGLTEDEYRRPMEWGERTAGNETIDFYREAVKLRNDNTALRRGDFKTLTAEGRLYAFKREYNGESVIAAFNAGEKSVAFNGHEIEPFGYLIDIEGA